MPCHGQNQLRGIAVWPQLAHCRRERGCAKLAKKNSRHNLQHGQVVERRWTLGHRKGIWEMEALATSSEQMGIS